MICKRSLDLLISSLGVLLLSPFLCIIYLFIVLESPGGGFYAQSRVGRDGREFKVFKFRTMYSGSDRIGRLTVGSNDKRITKIGKFLRRYKLDEFPQLLNVFLGDMSLVGPRPEVTEFIDTYTDEERSIILSVRPGITDNASVSFINENEFLSSFKDPLEAYITEVLPKKKRLQINYVNTQSCAGDFLIIFKTFLKIIK